MKAIKIKTLDGGGFELSWHSVYHRAILRVRNTKAATPQEAWEREQEFFKSMGWWALTCHLCKKPIDPPDEIKEHNCQMINVTEEKL